MSEMKAIQIPIEIFQATQMSPEEMRVELAVSLFQQKKLSFGKAREMADLSFWDFQELLADRKIPIHYDIDDLYADIHTLQKIRST